MNRIIKTYIPFAKGAMKEFVAYRLNFYIFILGNFLQLAVLLYIWNAVFASSGQATMNGFTFHEMVIYVIISAMTGMLTSNDIHWMIGSDVRSGDIAMNLIKPVSYRMRMYFHTLGSMLTMIIYLIIPMIVGLGAYILISGYPTPSIMNILFYIISSYLSSLLMFSINYLFGLAAFYVEYIFGFIFAKEAIMRLLSGELIPLAFYPVAVLAVFEWLPFAGVIYTPVMILMGKYTGAIMYRHLLIQLTWVIIMSLITRLLWNRAIKRLSILGG